MWNRIFPILLLCFLLLSCDHGCTIHEQHQAHEDVADAFNNWKNALNYMDERIILNAYEGFTHCAEEARECIGVDTTALSDLEAISKIYMERDPDTKRIQWAEERVRELESIFATPRKF